jgi:hypothetical protein
MTQWLYVGQEHLSLIFSPFLSVQISLKVAAFLKLPIVQVCFDLPLAMKCYCLESKNIITVLSSLEFLVPLTHVKFIQPLRIVTKEVKLRLAQYWHRVCPCTQRALRHGHRILTLFYFYSPYSLSLCTVFFFPGLHPTGNVKTKSLKPKLVQILFKNSVLTAKETQHFTVTNINRLTLFK